jgi:hypothetical protein
MLLKYWTDIWSYDAYLITDQWRFAGHHGLVVLVFLLCYHRSWSYTSHQKKINMIQTFKQQHTCQTIPPECGFLFDVRTHGSSQLAELSLGISS